MKRSSFRRGHPWKDRHESKRKTRVAPSLVPKALGKRLNGKGPWRSAEHRRRVVACGCMVAKHSTLPYGHRERACWGPIDPHHPTKWRGGGGRQPSDALVVPLCRRHHDACQARDEAFERLHGIDFATWISRFSAVGANAIAELTNPQGDIP